MLFNIPQLCMLCHDYNNYLHGLCFDCYNNLSWLSKACSQCNIPLPANSGTMCGACLKAPWPFKCNIIPLIYADWVKQLISAWKYKSKMICGKNLASLLHIHIQKNYYNQSLPQYILPIPLNKHKLDERGFNQSLQLAYFLAKKLKIKVAQNLKKITDTPSQASLSAQKRKKNLTNTFILTQPMPIQSVAIVDDVVTTGATVLEVAKLLRQNGIQDIHLWALARSI